jgi:hypothetical protein
MMRFGYGLITCQRYPGDPRGDADLYQEALGAAEEAERLGFDSVWTSEHHFADDSYAPSADDSPPRWPPGLPGFRWGPGWCSRLAPPDPAGGGRGGSGPHPGGG